MQLEHPNARIVFCADMNREHELEELYLQNILTEATGHEPSYKNAATGKVDHLQKIYTNCKVKTHTIQSLGQLSDHKGIEIDVVNQKDVHPLIRTNVPNPSIA